MKNTPHIRPAAKSKSGFPTGRSAAQALRLRAGQTLRTMVQRLPRNGARDWIENARGQDEDTRRSLSSLLARKGRMQQECPDHIARRLEVPLVTCPPEDAKRHEVSDHGQFLARQDRWEDLGLLIRQYDRARAATDTGLPMADLLAYGARADVTAPVERALSDPGLMPAHAPRSGLAELEDVLEEYPGDYGIALVVAHAHIDIGWAWRGAGWSAEIPARDWKRFKRHFARASEILDAFDAFAEDSPALAAARCALLAAESAPQTRVGDDYEDLIDLDPANPRHMRALGNHLLPRWFGSYGDLELEARRTAARTADIWGKGGYTWVYFDALAVDPGALTLMDVDLFLVGMRDILERRSDQHTVNMFAAYCAVTQAARRYRHARQTAAQQQLVAAFRWILSDYLREVHPLTWGLAAQKPGQDPDPKEIAVKGRNQALARIARHFERDLKRGARIVWADTGPMVVGG